ncbi:MAG: helix-turn-helix domain-containing protein [Micrococcales bacterium]|nr:helix-turn-helix domain-containing protein [Micrococcales bacterium]
MHITEGWGPRPTTDGAAGAAVVLSPQRRRVLDTLDEHPVGATAVARLLDLHVNTAREHLEGLVEAGLATRSRLAHSGRGRPAWGYAAERAFRGRPPGEYASLAGLLADFVIEQSDDVSADMTRLGRSWGARLMAARAGGPGAAGQVAPDAPPAASPCRPEGESFRAAEASVIELMDELGFAPEAASTPIRLLQCPMLEVAKERPEVVCSVHRGLVEGALQALGASVEGVRLDAFAARDACLLRLR